MSAPNIIIRKHILLVDDEPDVRNTMKLLLQLDHPAVTEAANGGEALEIFKPEGFSRTTRIWCHRFYDAVAP